MSNKRVIAYIDGFNLYFGLRDSGYRRYYWLDIEEKAKLSDPASLKLHRTKETDDAGKLL
jgi:hypothetical protein